MDWRETLREMTENVIKTIDHDNEFCWGKEDKNDVEDCFPAYESATITINGKPHRIEVFFIVDEQLPYALEWRKEK